MLVNNIVQNKNVNPHLLRFEKRKKWETIYLQITIVFYSAMALQHLVKQDFSTTIWLYLNIAHLSVTRELLDAIADAFRKFSALSHFRAELMRKTNVKWSSPVSPLQFTTNSLYLKASEIIADGLVHILGFSSFSKGNKERLDIATTYSKVDLKYAFKCESFWNCLSLNVSSISDKWYCLRRVTST